jgi:hypothetical protein
MLILEVLLVKNSIKLVFSDLNDRRLALSQLFIFVNIILMFLENSECFGLITIRRISSTNKIILVLLLLSILCVHFGKALM